MQDRCTIGAPRTLLCSRRLNIFPVSSLGKGVRRSDYSRDLEVRDFSRNKSRNPLRSKDCPAVGLYRSNE